MKDTNKPDALQGFASVFEQEVIWNDMDAFNHVNNVVYYRYAETARINYLAQLGMFDNDITIILAHSSCDYLAPVVYPDTLLIGVRTKKLGTTSLVVEYSYFSQAQQTIVATLEAVMVQFNKDATTKVAWTAEERDKILAHEKSASHTPQY